MKLHEFQTKQLFRAWKLPVPDGEAVRNLEEALAVADQLGGHEWVVKAQVHAGGRGKAGGVRLVNSKDSLTEAVQQLLGSRLVTYQTDAAGQPVNLLLIERTSKIARELYLSAIVDRASQCIVFMASSEGGVDIETVAAKTPEKILKIEVSPLTGVLPYQSRELSFALNFNEDQVKQFHHVLSTLHELFVKKDLSLLEINPLVLTDRGDLLCLDGKVTVDDNALYRQPEMRAMRDTSQEDERENRARDWELNYIALDGDIGCMVNGAGLAMATMDMVKLHGGNPANFLDVGGGATKERVSEAFKIILSDSNVKGVLVNIFGGIVRCDLIAEGIIGAVAEVGIQVPVVVRLEGNNAEVGAQKLASSGLNIVPAESLTNAAEKIVACVRGAK